MRFDPAAKSNVVAYYELEPMCWRDAQVSLQASRVASEFLLNRENIVNRRRFTGRLDSPVRKLPRINENRAIENLEFLSDKGQVMARS